MSKWKWVMGLVAALSVLAAVGAATASSGPEKDEVTVQMVEVKGEGAHFWSRWRGPSGQGLVEGGSYPDRWSDTENVIWKVELPVQGNSSPIIWGDHIFLTGAKDGGRLRSIVAFRRSDGVLLWETAAPEADPERAYPKNGHASSTVVTDGERVIAYLGNSGLLAVDFQGKRLWHTELPDVSGAFHGTAGSPLLYKDKVILYQDLRSGGSYVAAYGKEDGREIWKTPRTGKVGWGTPVAIRSGDHDEIIVSSHLAVYAYHPETGAELWRCDGNKFEVIPTPVVGQGHVYASSGRAGPTLAIRPGGRGNVTATHLTWKAVKGSPFVPSPILYKGHLYMVNDMLSIATAYDAASGGLLFQGRMGRPAREGFSASPVAFDDKIFFTNDQGQTFVLRHGREFKLLHVNDLKERTLASPALVEGRWYWRTERHLICIG